ncbi:MAG: hypothetical protein IKE65_09370 [Clostridia bacterium]|nr:hypothetical protein [Clostridia bacterium]
MKKSLRKVLAFTLSLVMMLSCLVFAAPSTVAEDAPAEEYDIKIQIYCDASNNPNISGAYGGIGAKVGLSSGVSLVCKDTNGAGDEMDEIMFDLGSSSNGNGYALSTGTHYLYARTSGFPYKVAGYCKAGIGRAGRGFQIQSIEVRGAQGAAITDDTDVTENFNELWSGTISFRGGSGGRGFGGLITAEGKVYGWDYGLKNADEFPSTADRIVSGDSGVGGDNDNYVELDSKYGWSDKMPYADSVQTTSVGAQTWPEAQPLLIQSNTNTFSPKSVACYDQYGVLIASPTKTVYGITQYDYESYGLEQPDIVMDMDTGVISKSGESYIAGNAAQHTLSVEIACFFGSKKEDNATVAAVAKLTSEQTIQYTAFSVSWKYLDNTYESASTSWREVQDSVLFGNTPTDADYPGDESTRMYFTGLCHYKNGTFAPNRVTSADTFYMQDYVAEEHTLSSFEPIEGDSAYHNHVCMCGYAVQAAHQWDAGVITTPASCTHAGVLTKTCTDCGETMTREIAQTDHDWDAGVITTPPSCGVNGVKTYTCKNCAQTKTERTSALEHEPVLKFIAPLDKHNGGAYYQCALCGCYWGAVYNESSKDYDIPDETPLETLEQALAISDKLFAPYFNTFVDETAAYDYSLRGAALKYIDLPMPEYQPLRFAQSVKVPENVANGVAADNVITDMGIVYSQTDYIHGADELQIGKENVYVMSLKDKNNTAFNGSNWSGATKHEEADGTYFTMNLVVSVKPENWTKDYCARAYITYTYNGVSYTVYDEMYSSRSVEYIARQVVNNPAETQQARDYCQHNIIDVIEKL